MNLSSNPAESSLTVKRPSVENTQTESHNLSNFRVTNVVQQNSDITYKGHIDAIEKNLSSGINSTKTTNTFTDTDASISILDGRILVINFDEQGSLFNEFRDIPLVGVIIK